MTSVCGIYIKLLNHSNFMITMTDYISTLFKNKYSTNIGKLFWAAM